MHIINGDSSKFKISVLVEELSEDLIWKPVHEFFLDNPGEVLSEYIWGRRRLVVTERE